MGYRASLLWVQLLTLWSLCASAAASAAIPRPDHSQHAQLARWLVHYNTWGTLSTQGAQGPAAGVVSFADGPLTSPAAGRLFFYLTPMDETGSNVVEHPYCALSVSEAQLQPNGCGSTDPMDPTCARLSLMGRMLPVEASDVGLARDALFTRHPAMKTWPADHGFQLYELHLQEIHMLDFYGGMHIVTPDDYFAARLQQHSLQQGAMLVPHNAQLSRRLASWV